jgi:hypothetical protein
MNKMFATILLIFGATQLDLLAAAGAEEPALEQRTQSFTRKGHVERLDKHCGEQQRIHWEPAINFSSQEGEVHE